MCLVHHAVLTEHGGIQVPGVRHRHVVLVVVGGDQRGAGLLLRTQQHQAPLAVAAAVAVRHPRGAVLLAAVQRHRDGRERGPLRGLDQAVHHDTTALYPNGRSASAWKLTMARTVPTSLRSTTCKVMSPRRQSPPLIADPPTTYQSHSGCWPITCRTHFLVTTGRLPGRWLFRWLLRLTPGTTVTYSCIGMLSLCVG